MSNIVNIPDYQPSTDHRRCDTCCNGKQTYSHWIKPYSCSKHCDEQVDEYGTCPKWSPFTREERSFEKRDEEIEMYSDDSNPSCYDCGYTEWDGEPREYHCALDNHVIGDGSEDGMMFHTCSYGVVSHHHCPRCYEDLWPDGQGFYHPCEKCGIKWDDYDWEDVCHRDEETEEPCQYCYYREDEACEKHDTVIPNLDEYTCNGFRKAFVCETCGQRGVDGYADNTCNGYGAINK